MSSQSEELIERVVEVTGASATEAEHLLGACANDVEAAVALYFEQGVGAAEAGTSTAAAPNNDANDGEDNVRAPIAPFREQLIGPEDDNFFAAAPSAASSRVTRSSQRVKICPLRDFAREGALMEQQLQAAAGGAAVSALQVDSNFGPTATNSIHTRWRTRATATLPTASASMPVLDEPKPTSSRLGDLFRPPTDIAYPGTFQAARARATACEYWMLVNVQSDNFDSQVLNRDVWSDKEMRKLIKHNFLLWQVDADSGEGRRFVAFYHCAKLPYVCIVDPRTGEEIWKSADPKQSTLLPDIKKFLSEHKAFSCDSGDEGPSTSKRSNTECITIDDDETEGNTKKRTKLMELSEEEQIALAIRNSMRENGVKGTANGGGCNDDSDNNSEFGSVEEFGDEDLKSACESTSYEMQLGSAKDELTALKLRLLNAEGVDELVQLRWPSDTTLNTVRCYIAQKHPHIPKKGSYKLICAFPRKTLEADHNLSSLKELGLHPSANLHVTYDD